VQQHMMSFCFNQLGCFQHLCFTSVQAHNPLSYFVRHSLSKIGIGLVKLLFTDNDTIAVLC